MIAQHSSLAQGSISSELQRGPYARQTQSQHNPDVDLYTIDTLRTLQILEYHKTLECP